MSKAFKAIGGLISKLIPMPQMPKIDIPAMPDPGSTMSRLAAQKKIASKSKSGREGTIYSGGSYGGSNLGGTA